MIPSWNQTWLEHLPCQGAPLGRKWIFPFSANRRFQFFDQRMGPMITYHHTEVDRIWDCYSHILRTWVWIFQCPEILSTEKHDYIYIYISISIYIYIYISISISISIYIYIYPSISIYIYVYYISIYVYK